MQHSCGVRRLLLVRLSQWFHLQECLLLLIYRIAVQDVLFEFHYFDLIGLLVLNRNRLNGIFCKNKNLCKLKIRLEVYIIIGKHIIDNRYGIKYHRNICTFCWSWGQLLYVVIMFAKPSATNKLNKVMMISIITSDGEYRANRWHVKLLYTFYTK